MARQTIKQKNDLLKEQNLQLNIHGLKVQIDPTDKQKEQIDKSLGCMRLVYNDLLAMRKKHYKETGKQLSGNEYKQKRLNDLKIMKPFLKDVDKFIFDDVIIRQDLAYDRFFKKQSGFPKYKSKKEPYQSYTTYFTNNNIRLADEGIQLPKLKEVKFRKESKYLDAVREGRAVIKKVTISRDGGKYYASFCIEEIVPLVIIPDIADIPEDKIIGIDVGIKVQAITSNGKVLEMPKKLKRLDKRMRRYQRSLSRKTKGSKNYQKAKNKLNNVHKKISNIRKNANHQISNKLVSENQAIIAENLAIKNMLKNHNLARAISYCGWRQLFDFISYKARERGVIFYRINRFFASSQICHYCGFKNIEVKDLKIREWTCPKCGGFHDRDKNAAINIKAQGIKELLRKAA